MRYLIRIAFFAIGLLNISMFAQEAKPTLEQQFTEVMETSNRYKSHKVIKIELLDAFQKSMKDTIAEWNAKLEAKRNTITFLEARIDSLEVQHSQLSSDLTLSRKKENGMNVFGIIIEKNVYQIVVWTIIGLLVIMVFMLLFRYRASNAMTKEANTKLAETEAEFETHRQRSLEREQQLRRKLQDEINKQKE